MARDYMQTQLGTEARCAKCRDFWPADPEFYFFQSSGKPHSWCKACYIAERVAKGQKKGYGNGRARAQQAAA